MKMRKITIFFLLMIIQQPVWAQFETDVSGAGTTAASFLEIGVGARAMALGGAYTAVADGPSALYYNPASIVWLAGYQFEFMHSDWLVDTNLDFVGAVIPLPFFNSSIGLSFVNLDYGEQPVRTVERPEGTGELYEARDFAVAVTYAAALTERFSFGLTGKYISQSIWNVSGGTAAIDLGIFYRPALEGLQMGMSISNFGGEISLTGRDLDSTSDPDEDHENIDRVPVTYKTDSFPLPILFRAGISYKREFGTLGSLLGTLDVQHPTNTTESISLGFEYGFKDMFFLRVGYSNLFEEYAENGLTLGLGLDCYLKNKFGFRIDYAYSDWGILDNSSRISIGLVF
jgi:hypothetical protein